MKLKVGRPLPMPVQRRDTGKWIANGTIAVHNDSARVTCDVIVHGPEFATKQEAVEGFFQRANLDFVRMWLNDGGIEQLQAN